MEWLLIKRDELGWGSTTFLHLFFEYDKQTALIFLVVILCTALFYQQIRGCINVIERMGNCHFFFLAFAVLVILCIASWSVYYAGPASMDEYVMLLQARIFASGELMGKYPPPLLDRLIGPYLQNNFIFISHKTGHIASAYWPGYALIQTPFVMLGIPWACNPVLATTLLAVLWFFAKDIFSSEKAGVWLVFFTLASPIFSVNAISFYPLTALVLFNLLFSWFLLKPTTINLIFAGFFGSISLTLHNPVPHILFAFPWFFWLFFQKECWKKLGILILAYIPLSLFLGVGWAILISKLQATDASTVLEALPKDSAVDFYDFWKEKINSVFVFPSYSLFLKRLIAAIKVWVWSMPGIMILAFIGCYLWNDKTKVRLWVASAVVTFVGYCFVPYDQGHGWGYRYFYPAWIALPILATAAVIFFPKKTSLSNVHNYFIPMIGMLIFVSLVVLTSFRFIQVHEFIGNVITHVAYIKKFENEPKKVVFVNGVSAYIVDYLVQNDPFLRNKTIMMWSKGLKKDTIFINKEFPENELLMGSDLEGSVWALRENRSVEINK